MVLGFSFVFPLLLVMAILQWGAALSGRDPRGWVPTLILGLISAGIVGIPVGGLPLARWLISLNANFSVTLTAILFCKVTGTAFGIRLLDGKALLTCWLFSVIAGVMLYPMALGLGRWDPYQAGWGVSWLFVVVYSATVVFLIMKDRFAMVMIAAIFAYNLHLLESTNLWDYLIDPFLVIFSCIALGRRLLQNVPDRSQRRQG